MKYLRALLLIFAVVLLRAAPAGAEITHQDFTVLMRAVGFLQPSPSGDVSLAIVYDPANAASSAEGRQMQNELGGSYKVGSMTLHPKLVPVSSLGGIDGASVIFVATGTDGYQPAIARMAKGKGGLTLTLDKNCVERGNCVLYVNTANRVEIIVNKSSAEASGVAFKPTFMVLVTTL
jgi:hypothetical protein